MARSRAEWESYLKALILSVNPDYDTEFGPVNAVFVQPESIVLSEMDAEITRLVQIMDIDNYSLMTDSEFVAFLKNYLIELMTGTFAEGVCYFQANSVSTTITVPQSFPVGTDVASYGQSLTFYTTESAEIPLTTKALFFNPALNLYEVAVPVRCVSLGAIGKVPAGAVRNLLRSLPGITKVTNRTAFSSGGLDAETKAKAIQRVKSFIRSGGSLALKGGIENELLNFASDVLVLGARDAGFMRTSMESGAVDAFVSEVSGAPYRDYFKVGYTTIEDFGEGAVWTFNKQPALADADIIVMFNGVDVSANFAIVADTSSAYSGSIRALDQLVCVPVGGFVLNDHIGEDAYVDYYYNSAIADIQTEFDSASKRVYGRDLMIRQAAQTQVQVSVTITALSGYDQASLRGIVETSFSIYINSLNIGEPLEEADLTFIAMSVAGVDNVTYMDLRRSTESSGVVHDIVANPYEFLRIDDSDLLVS